MPKLRPASRLYPRPEWLIPNALKINDPLRKMTRTLETSKRRSFPKILLLMRHQMGPNPHRHSPKRTRIVVLAEEDPNNKAKARILLPLTSMPLLSKRTRTKIKTWKIYPTLSAIFVSRKVIMPISVSRKSQKTSVSLHDFHVGGLRIVKRQS